MKKIKNLIKKLLGIHDFDREAERLIKKSIEIYHRGGNFNRLRAIRLHNYIRKMYGCNIWPGITVGNGMYISHAQGCTIGRTAIIGDNFQIYPNASIVAAVKNDNLRWEKKQRRHAKIGNDCIIGNGAIIIGPIIIGDNVTIGAGAIVSKDVPSHTVVKNVNEFRKKNLEELSSSGYCN